MMPSPMNLSSVPPWAKITSTMHPWHSFSSATTCSLVRGSSCSACVPSSWPTSRASCSGRLREGGPRREDGQRGHRAAPEADSVRWVESRPPPDLPGDVLSLLDHHLLDLGTYGDPSADDRIPALLRREGRLGRSGPR